MYKLSLEPFLVLLGRHKAGKLNEIRIKSGSGKLVVNKTSYAHSVVAERSGARSSQWYIHTVLQSCVVISRRRTQSQRSGGGEPPAGNCNQRQRRRRTRRVGSDLRPVTTSAETRRPCDRPSARQRRPLHLTVTSPDRNRADKKKQKAARPKRAFVS